MATEIEARPKQKVEQREEATRPEAYFQPPLDIYETQDALVLVADMPGVGGDAVHVEVDGDQLTIEGRIRPADYDGMKPVHVEYGVGSFRRRFTVSEAVDREGIKAQMRDGVLTLRLPKAAHARRRRIPIES